MKKSLLYLLFTVIFLLVSACSENDTGNSTEPEITYAYALDQFVPYLAVQDLVIHDPADSIDCRYLLYFLPVATDGFSPRSHSYDDMDYANFAQGFYIPFLNNRLKFPQFEAIGINAYNVKFMDKVYVFRGIKSIINDTLSVLYELNSMDSQMVENYEGIPESAIPLSSFVPEHVTELDSVAFYAVDDYMKIYYPEEIAAGFWLIETQRTIFPGLDLPNSKKKFKWLKSLEFFGSYQEIPDFENAYLAAETQADWSFAFPDDLSDYIGEPWD
jgi:hypothetical protein